MPENTQPENTQADDTAGAGGAEEEAQAGSGSDTPDYDSAGGREVATSYVRTSEGHRVTRRTVRRREVTEDTQETITETYPVPYQAPSPVGHPAPVG